MIRVIFFGMTGQFSIAPLEKLLTNGIDVGAVVVPAISSQAGAGPCRIEPVSSGGSDVPIVNPHLEENILHLAWKHDIPVWEVASLSNSATLDMLAGLQPDLITVACFPYIFPLKVLQLPRYGCVNLHPSLLPAYRGPEPLFWIARNDEAETGVTLHFLGESLDTGDIIAQTRFERPDGISGAELEQRCAKAGAELLLTAVRQLEKGPLSRRPQPERGASYFPLPSGPDFLIPTDWPARRAFNFLRGAEGWPLVIGFGDTRYRIRVAISYAAEQTLEQPYIVLGNELWLQFQPGVLRVRVWGG